MSGIGSIVIKENPVIAAKTNFMDNLVAGTPSAWGRNSYEQEIRAMGGFWKARFDILPRETDADYLEEYLLNGLGRNVDVYDPKGTLVWQGYISRMQLQLPGAQVSASLMDAANRVWVRYLTAEGGLIKRSTKQNDAASQDRFGIKETVLQGAIISAASIADQAALNYLNTYSNPRRTRITVRQSAAAVDQIKLTIDCRGYYDTLNWRTYEQTGTQGEQNANLQIQDIVDAVGQFVSSTILETNTTQVTQVYDRDQLAGDSIFNIARMGDPSSNRFIVGIYENRVLRYEQARSIDTDLTNLKYSIRVRDNRQTVRSLDSGQIVSPALVRPNEWLRVEDLFPTSVSSHLLASNDPQVTYVESVTYREPLGLTLPGQRAAQIDNLLASSGFGGASSL